MNSLQDCEWSRRCFSRQAINVSRNISFSVRQLYERNRETRTDFRSEGKPFRSRKNFVIKLFARDGRYYFSATHKNFTRPVFHETRISNEISFSVFLSSFFFFFTFHTHTHAHTHSPIYIEPRNASRVARLTRHDFQTTKLSALANVCKFVERISGQYRRSCDFY